MLVLRNQTSEETLTVQFNREYLTFSVYDRFYYTKSSIFTSGETTGEILVLVFIIKINIALTLKKSN